jgi:hypothetical protein
MNPILDRALAEALRGSPECLEEFGLERLTVAGSGIPGAGPEWEERLCLTGNGTLSLRTRRSIFDLSAEPIGEFQQAASRETVRGVIQHVRDARLDELPRFPLETGGARLQIAVVAGGVLQQVAIGVSDPAALSAQPLLQELDRLAAKVRANAVRTMRLNLSMPYHLRAAKMRLQITLDFQNAGEEGYWLTHPGALERTAAWERCSLLYVRKLESEPGVTPPPSETREAVLEPARPGGLDLFWVSRDSEAAHTFTATVELPEPGVYVARAVYSSYAGEDRAGGQARMRGCAFSNEVEIEAQ